ncbi:MAG: hypothetical protein ACLFPS_01970 [Clostridia bacterium]
MNRLKLIIMFLFFVGFYTLLSMILGIADKRAIKMINRYSNKNEGIRAQARSIVLKFIKVPEFYIKKFDPYFKKAIRKMSVKHFFADQFIQILIWVVAFLISISLSMKMIPVAIILLALADIFNRHSEVIEEVKLFEQKVIFELPQFIQYIMLSIDTGQDLQHILEKYSNISKDPLADGIETLLMNLKTGNMQDALLKFEKEFNMPSIRSIVSGLTKVNQGVNQKTYFYLLEKDIKMQKSRIIEDEIKKLPKKIRFSSLLVLTSFIIMVAYPAVLYIYNQIQLFY